MQYAADLWDPCYGKLQTLNTGINSEEGRKKNHGYLTSSENS